MIISVFCTSCKPICEPEITPVLYHIGNQNKNNFTFSVQFTNHTKRRNKHCRENFEENMDLFHIYLAVPKKMSTHGLGGKKSQNLVNTVCEWPLMCFSFSWIVTFARTQLRRYTMQCTTLNLGKNRNQSCSKTNEVILNTEKDKPNTRYNTHRLTQK